MTSSNEEVDFTENLRRLEKFDTTMTLDPRTAYPWGPWRILRSSNMVTNDQRLATAKESWRDQTALIELGIVPEAVLQPQGVRAARELSGKELANIRLSFLSATTRAYERVGQLYYGSHKVLREEMVNVFQGDQVIVMRAAILPLQSDPFAAKKTIESSISYWRQSWPDCLEEGKPPVRSKSDCVGCEERCFTAIQPFRSSEEN